MGPPIDPPYRLYLSALRGWPALFRKKSLAESTSLRTKSYAVPCTLFVPLLVATLTTAPPVCPCCASKLAVCTLNSCVASVGGTKATRRPLAWSGEPSSVNSFPPSAPFVLIEDVPALSKARENLRSPL